MQPFVFVSHASLDKANPEFARVLLTLHEAGIPLGIDRPRQITDERARSIPFIWSLPNANDFVEEINLGQIGASGAIFLASQNTPRGSFVWREFNAALAAKGLARDRYDFWCVDLDGEAYKCRPEDVRSRQFHRSDTELVDVISLIRAHLQHVQVGRLLKAAMARTVDDFRYVDIVGKRLLDGEYVRMPLDRIYTALRGDILSGSERIAAQRLKFDGVVAQGWQAESFNDNLENWNQDRATTYGITAVENVTASVRRGTRLNIATAVCDNPVLMILGEPASGKSTILRWLALRLATAWQEQDGAADGVVTASERHVDPDKTGDTPVEIGPLMLPILIPMSTVAAALSKAAKPDLLSIAAQQIATLCKDRHDVAESVDDAERVVRELAGRGRLLILLDGLDEVSEPRKRAEAIEVVVAFAERWTVGGAAADAGDPARGNRLVMTSRIVGYTQVRLPETWPHVVVDRMSEETVSAFWERLFDVLGQPDAKASASALHEHVFGEHGSNLEDITGIPLLAAMLAIVFRKHGTLPQRRAQIYEKVVQHLVEEQRPDPGAEPVHFKRWTRWLCVVAKVMHERSDDGLIDAKEYDRLLGERYREIDEGSSLTTFEQENLVRRFRMVNDTQVGLLVERAGDRYGFLHRTFQEYLAASWLMDEPSLMVDRLLDRWDEPAWREATLLAFGHESLRGPEKLETRDALVKVLFDRTDVSVRPHLAQFLCLALSEMPDGPSEKTVSRILVALLTGLRGELARNQPDMVRKRLSDAIYALADRDPSVFEACLARLLAIGDAHTRNALAELVAIERWYTPMIVEALKAATHQDNATNGYPVSKALRQALTDIAVQLNDPQPLPAKPRRPALGEKVQDEGKIAEIVRILSARREHIHRIRRWRVSLHFSKRAPLRRLRDLDRFLAAAATDRAWRAISVGLLGSLGDKDAVRGTEEYRRIAQWLQEPDKLREQAVDDNPALIGEFGPSDPIYNAAVYLDTRVGSLLGSGKPPAFDRRFAFPVTAMPEALLERAERADAGSSAARSAIPRDGDAKETATMFMAACLANLDGSFPVYARIAELPRTVREHIRALADQIAATVGDAAFRALQHLLHKIKETTTFTPTIETAMVQAIETCARLVDIAPSNLPEAFAKAGKRARAEYLAFNLAMLSSDDILYNASEALRVFDALELEQRAEALRLLVETAGRPWTRAFAVGWTLVFPVSKRAGDLPSHIFDGPENGQLAQVRLPITWEIQAGALAALAKTGAGGIKVALAPYGLLLPREYLKNDGSARELVVAEIEKLTDPYLQCRGFLAIAECGLGDTQSYIARARKTEEKITSPLERFIVLDRLLEFQTGSLRDEIADRAQEAAGAIEDPVEGWRACARVAARDPASRAEQFAVIAAMLDRIADPVECLSNWLAARRTVGDRLLCSRSEPRRCSDSLISRVTETGFRAPVLLALDELPGFSADATLALFAAQVCNDVVDAIELTDGEDRGEHSDLDDQNYLLDPNATLEQVEAALARIVRDPPALTAEWAALIQLRAERYPEQAARLASAIRIDSWFSVSVAENWLDLPNPALAFSAASAIVRKSPRRDRKLLAILLAEVTSPDDLRSAEACKLLTRGTMACRRPPRISVVGEYGLDGLIELGRFIINPTNRSIRGIAQCALLDVIHDDSTILSQLCDMADAGGADASIARAVLSDTVTADPKLLKLLGARLSQGSNETQRALIDALAAMAFEFDTDLVSEVARSVARLIKRPLRFLSRGGADIVTAARTGIEHGGTLVTQVEAAREQLLDLAVDLRERLSDADSAKAVLKAQHSSRMSVIEENVPVLHATDEIEAFRRQFGSRAVSVVGTWFTDLLLEDDYEDESLPYLALATSIFGRRTPSLLTETMVARAGNHAVLKDAISRFINGRVGSTVRASTLIIGCVIAPIDAQMAQALLQSVQSPLPDTFRRAEAVVLQMNPVVSAEALPVLSAAIQGSKARVAFIAIRLLGALVRNPRLPSKVRRQGRSVLEALVASERGRVGVFLFSPLGEKLDGAPIQLRGTLRDAALLEIARAEA